MHGYFFSFINCQLPNDYFAIFVFESCRINQESLVQLVQLTLINDILSTPIGSARILWHLVWTSILQSQCNLSNVLSNSLRITVTYTATLIWRMASWIYPQYKCDILFIHFHHWNLLDIELKNMQTEAINGSLATWKWPYSIQTFYQWLGWMGKSTSGT